MVRLKIFKHFVEPNSTNAELTVKYSTVHYDIVTDSYMFY